jgi:hypothetical protein
VRVAELTFHDYFARIRYGNYAYRAVVQAHLARGGSAVRESDVIFYEMYDMSLEYFIA